MGGGLFFLSFTINEIVFAWYFVIIIFILIIIAILLRNMDLNCHFWRQTNPIMPNYNCWFLMSSSSLILITSCLLPPTLRMTGPLLILLAMMRKGEGGWIGPSVECPLTSSSTICWQHHHFTQKIVLLAFKKVFA